MIPDYQTLMRPVLRHAAAGEVRIGDVVAAIEDEFDLTDEERSELLPSGKQRLITNRVHWAKTYLKQAGLVRATRRAHFIITEKGRDALDQSAVIDTAYLQKFSDFQSFLARSKRSNGVGAVEEDEASGSDSALPLIPRATLYEELQKAHAKINKSLASDLLERVQEAHPSFFEQLIVSLLVAMGYGGSSEEAGRAIGQSGDNGIDGVIDQDPLGVDQIYIQAKRYADGNNIGSPAIRDFFGALSLKRATKRIFVTTSAFSSGALETARGLGGRIVLIDGQQLARLMIRYNIGCRDEDVLYVKKVDEEFFE